MEKSERFGLVLTPAEKDAAARLAEGESVASLVRRLIREAAKAAGLWPPAPPTGKVDVEGVRNAN